MKIIKFFMAVFCLGYAFSSHAWWSSKPKNQLEITFDLSKIAHLCLSSSDEDKQVGVTICESAGCQIEYWGNPHQFVGIDKPGFKLGTVKAGAMFIVESRSKNGFILAKTYNRQSNLDGQFQCETRPCVPAWIPPQNVVVVPRSLICNGIDPRAR